MACFVDKPPVHSFDESNEDLVIIFNGTNR